MPEFFDRPGIEVAADLAAHWYTHIPTKEKIKPEIHDGQAKILAIETSTGVQGFSIAEVVLYTQEETVARWKDSRATEIDHLDPGEIICYGFRGIVNTFIKSRGAENLMISSLRQVDHMGDPLLENDAEFSSSKVAPMAGLKHKSQGLLTPFEFRGKQAFLLTVAGHKYPETELERIYQELMNPQEE